MKDWVLIIANILAWNYMVNQFRFNVIEVVRDVIMISFIVEFLSLSQKIPRKIINQQILYHFLIIFIDKTWPS